MTAASRDQALVAVRDWLNATSGIFYPDRKFDLFGQRMDRVLRKCGLADYAELARRLADEDIAVQRAATDAASTNHTSFFREPQVLDRFRETLLPDLMRHERIRIWSAACSTGDEAYTLGIIAAEAMGLDAAQARLAILGTDVSGPVVKQAEAAVYGQNHLQTMPEALLARYFQPVGMQQYRLAEPLRRICTFRRMNLKSLPYPFRNRFHAVFCRNILYYFDRETQRFILDALHEVTEPGGWLVTSVTESVRDLGTRWEPVATGIYRRPE
jgi:chemotaxis protein methyltransferase CheR